MTDFFIRIVREMDDSWLRWQREDNNRQTEPSRPGKSKKVGRP